MLYLLVEAVSFSPSILAKTDNGILIIEFGLYSSSDDGFSKSTISG